MNDLMSDLLSEVEREEQVSEPSARFRPIAMYNPDGDCIEIHLSDEPFYGKRLDGWFTAYYSEQTNDIVGGMLKGIKSSLLQRFPGINIDVEAGSAKIADDPSSTRLPSG